MAFLDGTVVNVALPDIGKNFDAGTSALQWILDGYLLTPGSLAIIEAGFRPTDRARAIGAWSGLGGVATAFGPLLGGYLIGAISWRAILVINLPIGIFVAWAATRHVPGSRDPMAGGRIDIRGGAPAALGLAGTTYALIEAPGRGASAAILVTAIGGVLALVAFFVGERRSAVTGSAE